MKHDVDRLLAIVYQHYPRGIESYDPRWGASEEHARLVAARKRAAADTRWPAMLRRISQRYPVESHSLHLPTGTLDACYSFVLHMPDKRHWGLWFHASFLAPYQVAYSWRRVVDVERTAALRDKPVEEVIADVHGLQFALPRSAISAEIIAELDEQQRHIAPIERDDLLFALPPDEEPCAAWICREIEATFGCEHMPPEVGTLLVPDVSTDSRLLGEATLFDCLFTDDHRWVREEPSPLSERPVCVRIDASRLPASFTPVATVLRAVAVIWVVAQQDAPGSVHCTVETNGTLNKQQLLDLLAETKKLADSPTTHDLLVAAGELSAAIAAWDGQGAPSEAMVACALKATRQAEAPSPLPTP